MQEVNEIIRAYLAAKDFVWAAYVFGSTVKGTARPDSDIDIGILFADNASKEDCFEYRLMIASDLECILNKPVDAVDLRHSSLFLQHQVRKYGKLIFERERSYRLAYEIQSRREYFDFQRILTRRSNALLNKL